MSFTTLTKLTMPETRTMKAASTQGADSAGSDLVTMATLRESKVMASESIADSAFGLIYGLLTQSPFGLVE